LRSYDITFLPPVSHNVGSTFETSPEASPPLLPTVSSFLFLLQPAATASARSKTGEKRDILEA
jgi:hypothetical protein